MEYVTQTLDELHVIGIAIRTANSRSHEIGALWQRFREPEGMRQISNPLSPEPYGVYFAYEGDYTAPFTLLAGLLVAPNAIAPEGMTKKRLAPAKYAVFSATGPLPGSVVAAWNTIWQTDLPRTYQADFEVYHSPESLDVYVGIE